MADRDRKPSVAAVITCYNLDWCIAEAIESVLPHVASGWITEIIVVDDGSRDNSRNIISGYSEKYPSIRSVFKENGGVASSKNAGINISDAEFVAFLDGDDLWSAEKFAIQGSYILEDRVSGIFVGDYTVEDIGKSNRVVVKAPPYDRSRGDNIGILFLSGGIIPSAAIVRRSIFEEVGYFDESIRYVQDEEMWSRISARYPVQRTPGVVLRKREHEGNMSSNVLARVQALEDMTTKYLALVPSLKSLLSARERRIALMRGKAHLARGEVVDARHYFWAAAGVSRLGAKALVFALISTLVPRPLDFIAGLKRGREALRGGQPAGI